MRRSHGARKRRNVASWEEIGHTGAALALALFALPANAQVNTVELPTIVVSPTLLPTLASKLGSSVTMITATDIQRQQLRTVPDALRKVPGLDIVQTGGPGGQTSVFLRGTNANHVKVLIDGIDVGNPSNTNGSFDFAHLLTDDIQSIEVLRGPQSGLYGSDAIGGVISITTKKGEGPPKVTATVEAGSLGTFNQTVSLRGAQANFNYAFNVVHLRSTDIPVTPLHLLAPGEKRNNNNYDNWTYSTKLGADLTDNVAVNLAARYTDPKLGFTGDDFTLFPLDYPEALQSTQRNRNFYGRGEAVWSLFDGRFKNYFGVNYTNQWDRNLDPNADFSFASPAVAPPITIWASAPKSTGAARSSRARPDRRARAGAPVGSAAHRFDRHGRCLLQLHANNDHRADRQRGRLHRTAIGIR